MSKWLIARATAHSLFFSRAFRYTFEGSVTTVIIFIVFGYRPKTSHAPFFCSLSRAEIPTPDVLIA